MLNYCRKVFFAHSGFQMKYTGESMPNLFLGKPPESLKDAILICVKGDWKQAIGKF